MCLISCTMAFLVAVLLSRVVGSATLHPSFPVSHSSFPDSIHIRFGGGIGPAGGRAAGAFFILASRFLAAWSASIALSFVCHPGHAHRGLPFHCWATPLGLFLGADLRGDVLSFSSIAQFRRLRLFILDAPEFQGGPCHPMPKCRIFLLIQKH